MAAIDVIYHDLLQRIVNTGYTYLDPNRKEQGVYRKQINKFNFDYDMEQGFPALTTKKLAWKSIVGETLWFLRGDTNIKYLVDNGIPIWNKDAYNYYTRTNNVIPQLSIQDFIKNIKEGELESGFSNYKLGDVGKNYSYQLRNWTDGYFNVDQLQNLINTLKTNPMATKKIVTYWNPAESKQTALTPCHRSWEVMVRPLSIEERQRISDREGKPHVGEYELSLSFDMSSVDVFLGLPFNIASYGLKLHTLATMTGMEVGALSGNLTNVHIYEPHLKAVETQLSRDPFGHKAPELNIPLIIKMALKDDQTPLDVTLEHLEINDFKLKGYESYGRMSAEMIAYDE